MKREAIRRPVLRFGLILWLAGMVGVLSMLLMPLPLPEGIAIPIPSWLLKLLSLIQPAILLALAVWAGVKLAPRVNLSAPGFEALAAHRDFSAALRPQITPGLAGGLFGGVVLVIASFFMPAALAGAEEVVDPPLATRMLYGGITEELLVRWGLMTVLLWASWRLFQSKEEAPRLVLVWSAIVLSALLFGVSHLPAAFVLAEVVTSYLMAYIIIANALFGMVAGYLYWKHGLEAAIVAHAGAHLFVFLIAQTPLLSASG